MCRLVLPRVLAQGGGAEVAREGGAEVWSQAGEMGRGAGRQSTGRGVERPKVDAWEGRVPSGGSNDGGYLGLALDAARTVRLHTADDLAASMDDIGLSAIVAASDQD